MKFPELTKSRKRVIIVVVVGLLGAVAAVKPELAEPLADLIALLSESL